MGLGLIIVVCLFIYALFWVKRKFCGEKKESLLGEDSSVAPERDSASEENRRKRLKEVSSSISSTSGGAAAAELLS